MINAIVMMVILGALLGCILGVSSIAFVVETDEREEVVLEMLPGYNCGACGFPGCSGLARALVDNKIDYVNCKPAKPEQRQQIADYLSTTIDPNDNQIHIVTAEKVN